MLRIGLAKLLHKLPSEIDEMAYEDALLLVAHGEWEHDQMQHSSSAPSTAGGGRTETHRTVLKKRSQR